MKESRSAALRPPDDDAPDPTPAACEPAAGREVCRRDHLAPKRDGCGSSDDEMIPRSTAVLLVDSPGGDLDASRSLVAERGFRVLRARDERAALDSFVRERPQVVVLPYGLLAGGENRLIQQIRTVEPAVPIIVRGDGLTTATRRRLIVQFEINAVHDERGGCEALLELLDRTVAGTRCVERMRTEYEARSLILADLCHALRTPLHIIQGYAELLQTQPAEASFDRITRRVSRAVDEAIDLMHDYVDLARLDAPGRGIPSDRVDIDQLLADIRAVTERQIGKRDLHLRIGATVPGASLLTDRARLRAILTQLLTNAVKFTPTGDIELFVHPGRGSTAFIVADRGAGVPEPELRDMFTPFRQGGRGSLSSVPGQGIGLAIAERLSALIGASLAVRRRPHGGLLFLLTVPGELTAAIPTETDTLH